MAPSTAPARWRSGYSSVQRVSTGLTHVANTIRALGDAGPNPGCPDACRTTSSEEHAGLLTTAPTTAGSQSRDTVVGHASCSPTPTIVCQSKTRVRPFPARRHNFPTRFSNDPVTTPISQRLPDLLGVKSLMIFRQRRPPNRPICDRAALLYASALGRPRATVLTLPRR